MSVRLAWFVALALGAGVSVAAQSGTRSRTDPTTPPVGTAQPRVPVGTPPTTPEPLPPTPPPPTAPTPTPTPTPDPTLPTKRVLTVADFSYLGYYDIQTNGQNSTYGQALTHRYVDGDLRLLTLQLNGELHEVSLTGLSFGDLITNTTDTWRLSGMGLLSNFTGIWWEAAKSRLWVTTALDYTAEVIPVRLSTVSLGASRAVTNVHTPVGLTGLNAKRVYGGAQPVPSWFQSAFGVGPYVVGWGGYTSLVAQGGSASLGPTMYAIPDPAGYAAGSSIPSSAYKTIMDSAAASGQGDWYARGAPSSFDRGVRASLPVNFFDGGDARPNPSTPPTGPPVAGAQWLSPAPDGLGRFVWGDSYYNTGLWIDTPSRHGFIMVASLCGGRCWYQQSTLAFERRVFELHIWDPARFGEALRGARAVWDVKPTSLALLNLPLGNSTLWGGNSPTGNIGGATFDPTTGRLYLIGFGVGADVFRSRIFVLQVAQ